MSKKRKSNWKNTKQLIPKIIVLIVSALLIIYPLYFKTNFNMFYPFVILIISFFIYKFLLNLGVKDSFIWAGFIVMLSFILFLIITSFSIVAWSSMHKGYEPSQEIISTCLKYCDSLGGRLVADIPCPPNDHRCYCLCWNETHIIGEKAFSRFG